ncbi:MAG: MarC family protein [Candidatus Diapherotrites archaeon]|nr:MarC family protein [Candidatus Diapherotrites archaeon]
MMEFIQAFILLLVIMDPIVSLGALLSFTTDNKEDKKKIAVKSVLVAGTVFLVFALSGDFLLQLLGVSIDSFKAAGGIILILLGIQMAMGFSFPKKEEKISEISVVIGTPLISGPATITTTILLVKESGLMITLGAGLIALFVVLITLLLSKQIDKLIGHSGMRVVSTMLGIVTIAWGIQFLFTGAVAFFV